MKHPWVELRRIAYSPGFTFGVMRVPGDRYVYTMEDGWADNRVGVSCIPDGKYRVVPRLFHRGGYMAWEVTNVPGRTHILIHKGNTAFDVTGCIVVGTELGAIGSFPAVLNSKDAWGVLHDALAGKEFDMTVRPLPPIAGTGAFVNYAGG